MSENNKVGFNEADSLLNEVDRAFQQEKEAERWIRYAREDHGAFSVEAKRAHAWHGACFLVRLQAMTAVREWMYTQLLRQV